MGGGDFAQWHSLTATLITDPLCPNSTERVPYQRGYWLPCLVEIGTTLVTLSDPDYIKFQHELETCPLGWRKTVHWIVFPTIF